MTLSTLPKQERPRERLLLKGSDTLSLTELLAICLGSGRQGVSVLQLAEELLSKFRSLAALLEAPIESLVEIKGIGIAKAVQLKAVFALAKRSRMLNAGAARVPIKSSEDLYLFVSPEFYGKKREHVMVVMRDVKGMIFHYGMIGEGTLSEVLIHPREVFYEALKKKAYSIMLVHNHPSGDPLPSQSDIEVTKILLNSGKILDIALDDHMIIGAGRYFSFWERGYIQSPRY